MNEEELKNIWNADRSAPKIGYNALRTSLQQSNDKLRRKVRIEVWVQIAAVVLNFVPAFFYPKWIVFAIGVAALGVWYIPELRRLAEPETIESARDVRQSLALKILTMRRYFRRTRIALYVFSPLLVPAAFYGFGYFDYQGSSVTFWILYTIGIALIFEAAIVIANEIYFAVVYKPVFDELKNMLRQLEFDE